MRASLLSFALIPVTLAAAAQQAPHPVRRATASNVFKPTDWSLMEAGRGVSPQKLELSPSPDGTEELIVYGKRIQHEDRPAGPAGVLTLGPATLTGTTQTNMPGLRGMTITAAVPVPGIAGLDAVLNVSGGHDQVNSSTTAASAAAVVGLRMKF